MFAFLLTRFVFCLIWSFGPCLLNRWKIRIGDHSACPLLLLLYPHLLRLMDSISYRHSNTKKQHNQNKAQVKLQSPPSLLKERPCWDHPDIWQALCVCSLVCPQWTLPVLLCPLHWFCFCSWELSIGLKAAAALSMAECWYHWLLSCCLMVL